MRKTVYRKNFQAPDRSMPKIYMVAIAAIFLLSTLGIFIGTRSLFSNNSNDREAEKADEVIQSPEVLGTLSSRYPWWNKDFSYFRQITIENNDSTQAIEAGAWVKVPINHKDYIDNGKALFDGTDLSLVYLKEDNKYQKVNFELFKPNATDSELWYQVVNNVKPSSADEQYFIYYGNAGAENNPTLIAGEGLIKFHNENFESTVSSEATPKVFGSTNRRWIIRAETTDQELSSLNYTVTLDDSLKTPTKIDYTILDTSIKGSLKKKGDNWVINDVNIDILPVGKYQIQASFKLGEKNYTSQKSTFHISAPLYVAMTLDWEGSNVEDTELAAVTNLSARHNDFPYTHYVNPRTFINTVVDSERGEYLAKWLKNRESSGDQIALHLHMNFDMIEKMGIKVIKEPQWTDYVTDGHDVPMTLYSYEEQVQMLEWSKRKFVEMGFQTPTSFRAGGWFADENTLKALNNTGFKIDTSGREYYIWGNNKVEGHWTLTATTQPYRPSTTNQNTAFPAPQLDIWEFPNNGADFDYYQKEQLITKFNSNYSTKYLSSPKVITFLSHPHGYEKRMESLEVVFSYIDKLTAVSDNGPVIYESHDIIYNEITAQ